jgi:hypothetical protein
VETDFAFGCFGFEIRGDIANSQRHEILRGVADIFRNASNFRGFMYGSKRRNTSPLRQYYWLFLRDGSDKSTAPPRD